MRQHPLPQLCRRRSPILSEQILIAPRCSSDNAERQEVIAKSLTWFARERASARWFVESSDRDPVRLSEDVEHISERGVEHDVRVPCGSEMRGRITRCWKDPRGH